MSSIKNKRLSLLQLQRKLFNSRFFTISVLLHLILILSFGGTVLFNKYSEPPDFTGDPDSGFVAESAASTPPPTTKPIKQDPTFTVTAPASATKNLDAITTSAPTMTAFSLPTIAAPVLAPTMDANKLAPNMPNLSAKLTMDQAKDIARFTRGWAKNKPGSGVGSSPRKREFEFTAYLAKYGDPNDTKRGGDWASTNWIDKTADGKETIWGGSLPNLLYFMSKFSQDKIHSLPQPVPLDLSSPDIFAKKPPFIFFTGHRDFVLTDQEVANLQKYVRLGGCIWGDSSLPGHRSRFDLAFRREMRRVIPDANKDWEEIPANHAMFTKDLYYPEVKTPPPGINFYHEPVYALKFADQVAVIYTANDYGDMWQIGLTDKLLIDDSRDEKGRWVALNQGIFQRRDTYFRNAELKPVHECYKFGTNLVIHLITRWEDELKMVPQGL